MRDSLLNPYDVRRYLNLWSVAVFDDDGDSGGDSDGGGDSSSSSKSSSSSGKVKTNQDRINEIYANSDDPWATNGDELNALVNNRSGTYTGGSTTSSSDDSTTSSSDDKPSSGVGAGNKFEDGSTSLGSVSETGQYAGDGYEWKQGADTNVLTREFTGANADAGLGTDVIAGGTADKDVKEAIAQISLDEGTAFAGSASSATDHNLIDFIFTGDSGGSNSYAAQQGVGDYQPDFTYDSSLSGSVNEAIRSASSSVAPTAEEVQSFSDAFAENLRAGADTFEYNGKLFTTELASKVLPDVAAEVAAESVIPTGGPGTFTVGSLPAASASLTDAEQIDNTIDYTVSQGEAGRGGLDSAAPTFSYEPGVDPELEMLVSLKNSGVDLEPNEYLKATVYEKEKAEAVSEPGISVASPVTVTDLSPTVTSPRIGYESGQDVLQSVPDYMQGTVGGVTDAFYGQGPSIDVSPAVAMQDAADLAEMEAGPGFFDTAVDVGKHILIGAPKNVGEGIKGAADYFTITDPISSTPQGTVNPFALLTDEIIKLALPQDVKEEAILSADLNAAPSAAVDAASTVGSFLTDTAAPYLENLLQPETPIGVVTGDTLSDLKVVEADTGKEIIGAGDQAAAVAAMAGGEGIADTGLDILATANPLTRGLSAVINAGEQLSGLESGISNTIDNAYVSGQLDNNPMFQKALELQGGDVDNALAALKNLAYVSGDIPAYAKVAATGAVDAVLPGPAKGLVGLGKEAVKRGTVEAGQGAYESYEAINAVNNALGTNFDTLENIAGAAITEGIAGTTAAVVSPLAANTLSASQQRALNDAADQKLIDLANQAATGSPVVTATPVEATPSVQTSVFQPTGPNVGEAAQSTVPSAYNAAEDQIKVPDPIATSLDVMAAQEIIENEIRETGTISPEVMTNLQAATGLSMNDLSSMAINASMGTLGGQTFPINVGSETPSDLMDQPTGIGGGSNISVEPLPSGETLLRNNDTGRTTIVDQGADLAAAIQTFDEVTTPFIDTRNPLQLTPDMLVDEAPLQLTPDMLVDDTVPVVPAADTSINLEDVPSNLTLTDAKSLGPNIDLSDIEPRLNLSFPETPAIPADPELTTVYHATKGAPFTQFDPTLGDNYYTNMGAFGPGFYGSLDTRYPSEYVGGIGSLMSTQIDTSGMLDARNNKPLTEDQTAGLQTALENRTDFQGNSLKVSQDGNTLSVEYVRKPAFFGESEEARTVTRTIDTTNPTDVFQKVNVITQNIKNPLAKDDQGLLLQSEQEGDTQNLREVLTEAGFTGVLGIEDTGGGQAGDKDNLVVFDNSLIGDMETIIDQDTIPTSAADLAITNKMDADATAAADAAVQKEADPNDLSTIPTKVLVGDTLQGLDVADSAGQDFFNFEPMGAIEIRGTLTPTRVLFGENQHQVIDIHDTEYGTPVYKAVSNKDGTKTIMVGSRIKGEGGYGRDNYTSAGVVVPGDATPEQLTEALEVAYGNWKSNYEGVTSSDDIERNAATVLENSNITTYNPFDSTQEGTLEPESEPKPEDVAATDQTARVMEVLQNARSQQIAGGALVSKTGIQSLRDAGLVSEEALSNPMIAQAEVTELLSLGPDEVKARMDSDVAAVVEIDETTETPVFTSVRTDDTTETPVFTSVRTDDTTDDSKKDDTVVEVVDDSKKDDTVVEVVDDSKKDDTVVEMADDSTDDTGFDTEQQLEFLLDDDQTQQLNLLDTTDPVVDPVVDPEVEVEADPEADPEVEVEIEGQTVEPEPEVIVEPEPEPEVIVEPEVKTKPFIEVDVDEPPEEEEEEEEEVVVEQEEEEEPKIDVLVPPVVTVDEDGNTVQECPDGYKLVETGSGPMCQKTTSVSLQRAGASTRAYTGLSGNVGRRGLGQKRKTFTSTQQVRPTISNA
jgi:hypothetical protein